MEIEGVEQQIFLQPEMAIVGAVYSVNGYTGHVVLTTSDLENTSDYQTSTDVAALISAHNTSEEAHPYIQALISAKQDPIVAGNGINVSDENVVSVDTTVVATQQNLATEVTNRENADIALQGQIDAISASSDVVDIVGTYAELQSYDTSKLKDNDIIKVLQDSTQGNATTYYRWSTTTQTFTLIGQEGPYYTKAAADAQFVPQTRTINSKPLSANITLTASDVSALGQSDIVQTTGASTTKVMSQNAVTTALATKLDSSSVPDGFFDGEATVSPTPGTSLEIENAIKVKTVELQGDTQQQTYTGKNLFDISKVLTNGTNLVNNDDGSITASLATGSVGSSPNTLGTYCPSLQVGDTVSLSFTTTGSINYVYLGSPASQAWVKNANKTITQDMLNAPVYWYGGTGNTAITYSDIQVELGTSVTSYEPYVGGVPSPSPDYPQTVSVVTGTQTVTVTGKNLFDRASAEENKLLAWVTGTTSNEAGSLVSDYIPVTPTTKMIFTYNAQVMFYNSAKDYLGALQTDGITIGKSGAGGGTFKKITVPDIEEIAYMRLGFRKPLNPAGIDLLTADIQVERGEVATTYESYQSKSYEVDLAGDNLFDISKVISNSTSLVNNGDGTLTVTAYGTYAASPNTLSAFCPTLQAGDEVVLIADTTSSNKFVYLAGTNTRWNFGEKRTILASDLTSGVLWYSNNATTPATISNIKVAKPIELYKIGDYQDYIYKSGDDWYIHKDIGKSIVTGDSSESWLAQTTNTGYMYRLALADVGSVPAGEIANLISDYFTPTTSGVIYNITSGGYIAQLTTSGYIRFSIGDTTNKLSEFRTWLGTHNTTVYYALATATDTKITDSMLISQLEELASATLYRPTSNIVVSGNLPAILGITAYTDNLSGIIEILANS